MAGCQEMLKNAYFSPLFRHFRPNYFFSCRAAYSIFKVVHQASLIPKIRKIYGLVAETCSKTQIFQTFFTIFGPKKIFSCKTAYAIFKVVYQASLVTYQKSEKSMVWLPRNAKKCIFCTPFCHFWPKKIFFKNPAL